MYILCLGKCNVIFHFCLHKAENHEPCRARLPKMDGLWWRGPTECGPPQKGMANHSSILALTAP